MSTDPRNSQANLTDLCVSLKTLETKLPIAVISWTDQIFTRYKEFMVAWREWGDLQRAAGYPNGKTPASPSTGGTGFKRDDEFAETKGVFTPSLKSDVAGDSLDILEHCGVTDHVTQAVQTQIKYFWRELNTSIDYIWLNKTTFRLFYRSTKASYNSTKLGSVSTTIIQVMFNYHRVRSKWIATDP